MVKSVYFKVKASNEKSPLGRYTYIFKGSFPLLTIEKSIIKTCIRKSATANSFRPPAEQSITYYYMKNISPMSMCMNYTFCSYYVGTDIK